MLGDLASCCSSSIDKVFALDGEVGRGSVLVDSSVIGMSISFFPIPSSCSPVSISFLELSSWGCVSPDDCVCSFLINTLSRVVLASRSPSQGFQTKSSEVGANVSPGSSSCVINTVVMCEASEPSSSSYMVIKYMRIIDRPVSLYSFAFLCWDLVVTGDPT